MSPQTACLGDFNGDGALDLVLVLPGGEVWLFPRKVEEKGGAALAVIAALPPGGPTAGPVNVLAWRGKRLLGSWSVRPGQPGALIGAREPGPIKLKWTLPGEAAREKEVIVETKPVRVDLGGK